MKTTRSITALLALGTAVTLLSSCGSDDSSSSPAKSGGGDATAAPAATGGGDGGGGGGGDVSGPCDLADRSTVAAVFPGASEGKPGKIRNCEFTVAAGKVNVFYFGDLTLAEYKKQDNDNDIKTTDLSVGDGGFRDQLGTVAVGKDDYCFAVQMLPTSGLKDIPKYQTQTLALAKKIFGDL